MPCASCCATCFAFHSDTPFQSRCSFCPHINPQVYQCCLCPCTASALKSRPFSVCLQAGTDLWACTFSLSGENQADSCNTETGGRYGFRGRNRQTDYRQNGYAPGYTGKRLLLQHGRRFVCSRHKFGFECSKRYILHPAYQTGCNVQSCVISASSAYRPDTHRSLCG